MYKNLEIQSNNSGDYDVRNCNFWEDTAKIGISDQLSQKYTGLIFNNFSGEVDT